jgi:uncharacterized membrane protein (UPF0127 family)
MKQVGIASMVLLVFVGCGGVALNAGPDNDIKVIPLNIGEHKFTVEVADTSEKWTRGMMYREYIADDFGMLFVSGYESHHSFWMKNCKVRLDIIFLDKHKQVINIHYNVPPCTSEPCPGYASERPAQYVLELRANRAKELKMKPGDVVSFEF